METWLQDLRYACRAIRRQPGATLTAVVTLALGIGTTTAIFGVVYAVVLRPLPFTEPDRIVALSTLWTKTSVHGPVSAPDFHDWQAQSRSFESLAYYIGGERGVVINGTADYATVFLITPGFFQALGLQPRLGRLLSTEEERGSGPLAAVITDAFWRREFAGDPLAAGSTFKIGSRIYTIVGVLPPGARFPERADVYVAASIIPENPNRGGHNYWVVGRLASGVTVDQAQSDMTAIAGRLAQQYPRSNIDKSVAVVSLQDRIVGDARLTLYVLLAAVSFVLLIACANVANLLLARATSRAREMIVRAAIGAWRLRLVRQLLTESALMGLLAGVGGVVLAYLGVRTLIAVAPADLPRLDEIAVSLPALGFALTVSLLASVVFGLAPAWQLSRVHFAEGLRQGGTGSSGAALRDWTRSAFVVAEVAFAVVLVTGAMLLGRSLVALAEVDLGFDTERVLALRTSVPIARFDDARQATLFYREVLPEIRTIRGVTAAGAVWGLPTRSGSDSSYAIEGSAVPEMRLDGPHAILTVVTPDYFRTMRVPVVHGRDFADGDRIDAPFVAIVNESLVRASFSGQDALGHRIRNGLDSPEWMTIVGVVKDIRTHGPEEPVAPEIYMPFEQHPGPSTAMTIVARASADPRAVAPAIIARIRTQNPDVPVRLDTLEEVLSTATATPRFRTYVLGTFAVVALLLALAGVYSVVAFSVSQRVTEIGLRVALGAAPRDILRLVIEHGGRLTAIGIAVGIALSLALSRLISGLLFGVAAHDPIALAGVVAAVGTAALVACYVPALFALRIKPMMALRSE